jgi:uracil-DNA glycosylase family 4
MHRVGLANQPTSTHADDGLEIFGTRILSAVRCAPPQNKPTTEERDTCAPWADREVRLVLPSARAVVCLGSFGWEAAFRSLAAAGLAVPRPRPKFGHGVEVLLSHPGGDLTVLGCFHPSQQNTFTGRLTEPMLDAVLGRAAELGRVGG